MRLAIAESHRHWGLTHPNPSVGTVVVKNNRILSAAVTSVGGRPHSEANALKDLGKSAEGSTAYVTLEPCTHYGKTPPCCDLLIERRVRKVFIGTGDPNPLVNGKGIRRLRAAGIGTVTGVLQADCAEPNEWFLKKFKSDFPYVTIKTAMSLDGKIATKSGDSRWISSPESLRYSHLLRSRSDAIMVGTNTILRDNPTLNVRLLKHNFKNPHKIVLDRRAALKAGLNIFKTFAGEKILYFTSAKIPERFARHPYVRPFRVPERKGKLDLREVLLVLRREEIYSLLVEGGEELNGSLFDLGLVDKVEIAVAPSLVGGAAAPTPIGGGGITKMKQSLGLKNVTWTPSGRDMIVKGFINRYY